ncbi:MAG: hypothetical protein GY788_23050, partial [bacterium]|nr:hypothetical protein [bacterium]
MAFTVVTVTGTYTNADGDPAKGSVTFYPSALLANSSGDRMAPTARVKVELDDTGSLSIPLFATDDADTLPIGGTYTIVERISGADERIWRTAIPNASGTIDLADLAPVNTPPYISYSPVGHSHSEFDWIDGWLPTWLLWPDEMRAIQTALSNVENQKVRVAIVGCDAVSGAGATNRLAGLAGQTAQRLEVAFNNANGGDGYYGLEDMGPTGFSSADTGIDGKGMSATSAASVNQVSAASHGAVIFHDASQTGTWRYQVDAGGWTSVVSTGVGVPGTPVAVDYGSTGSFDLQIEWVSGTVSIDGVHFTGLDPTPNSGLEVLAAGVANETLADIDSTTRIDSYGGNGVDLVIVMTGYRDLTDAVAQDAWGTNITDVITKLRAENTNMSVLVVPYWEFASTSETVWESWRQEAKTRAAANSAAFLDLYNLIGSTDTDPYSYTSDGDELVDLGHSYIGL